MLKDNKNDFSTVKKKDTPQISMAIKNVLKKKRSEEREKLRIKIIIYTTFIRNHIILSCAFQVSYLFVLRE